jgi:transmembrane sensor
MNKKMDNVEMNNELLIEYLNGNLNEVNQISVEKWYLASKENQKILDQLYFTIFVSERIGVMENIDVEESLREFKRRLKEKQNKSIKAEKTHHRLHFSKYVAAAVLAGVIIIGSYTATNIINKITAPFTVLTNIGERAQVLLPDGTKVWLNASSKIEYSTSIFSRTRNVKMNGEAYFEVKKDKSAPFIVNSNGMFTKVLGTKFNICANADEHFITETLLEGSTRITAPLMEKNSVEMKPYQQFRLDTNTGKTMLTDCSMAKEYIGWIDGKLHFEKATLFEIALTLERYYNVRIVFANNKIKQERFTCDFETKDNIYQILSILRKTHKFDYTTDKRNVRIFSK